LEPGNGAAVLQISDIHTTSTLMPLNPPFFVWTGEKTPFFLASMPGGEGKESEGKECESIVEEVQRFCIEGNLETLFENFSKEKAPQFYDSAESKSDEPEHKLE
jgi:hypothetical protein